MVRHYKMKGHKKRKRDKVQYDKEENGEEEYVEKSVPGEGGAEEEEDEENINEKKRRAEEIANELPSLPIVLADDQKNANKPGVIFILEKASLEVAKVGKNYQLLNSDKHANFLRRNGRNPADYRPDIAHQAILMILDSTLNKSGRMKALYVKTEKGVLFEIKPHVRIPRTFDRFSGIMLQLLQKLSITAVGKREKLLQAIQNPVTKYLPINSRKIGFSHSSQKLVDMQDYVAAVGNEMNLVFVVGAMAHGKIDVDYVEDFISISDYPLSAAFCISRICNAVERNWRVL
ncbi:ribosomal RNA small subunit methyltransferase NEP1 [Coffea eugenioides]|uniref:ribosomal RNA small subunit methyltransferase NEP1 n=1 Tax=Coffea eugenioides TaxID=49369 RepID=UPI000F608D94|nr:ribosomal RNA small subunit methyltransferase NEP1 [Coffea eugenioides]